MHHDSGEAGGQVTEATPEERVLHLARKWRDCDKAAAANRQNHQASTAEYRARQALRAAIDRLPRSSSKPD